MKDLVHASFSKSDEERIKSCVKEVESKTAGEIVPMIVSASHHHHGAGLLGAVAIGFGAAFVGNIALSFARTWHGFGILDLWLFPLLFGVVFFVVLLLEHLFPSITRLFSNRVDLDAEVAEAAYSAFFKYGLGRTRDRTGILVYISIFERMVHVIADEGIHAKVEEGSWNRVVATITRGFKSGRPTDAICEALTMCGDLLAKHFPRKPGDTDELANLIIEK